MSFKTLVSLTSITASRAAEAQVEQDLAEAKNASSDFSGISTIVDECLEDLTDKISALQDLAKETGAIKLDTIKDKDGLTVFKKLDKLTKEYASAMKKLMSEAEAMVMQVAEGEEAEGDLITEGKDYSDSSEFTDEFYAVKSKVTEIKRIVKAPRWMNWMKVTDHNFSSNTIEPAEEVISHVNELDTALAALEEQLHEAS